MGDVVEAGKRLNIFNLLEIPLLPKMYVLFDVLNLDLQGFLTRRRVLFVYLSWKHLIILMKMY
jgi:hypothetical protein